MKCNLEIPAKIGCLNGCNIKPAGWDLSRYDYYHDDQAPKAVQVLHGLRKQSKLVTVQNS